MALLQFCMRERGVRPASGPARSGCGRPVAAWLGPIEREEGAVWVGNQTPPPEPPHVCRPLPLRAAANSRGCMIAGEEGSIPEVSWLLEVEATLLLIASSSAISAATP